MTGVFRKLIRPKLALRVFRRSSRFRSDALEQANSDAVDAGGAMHSPSFPPGYVKSYDDGRPRH